MQMKTEQGDATVSHGRRGLPAATRSHGEAWDRFSLPAPGGKQPCPTLISGSGPSTVRQYVAGVCASQSVAFCYGRPSKLIHQPKGRGLFPEGHREPGKAEVGEWCERCLEQSRYGGVGGTAEGRGDCRERAGSWARSRHNKG